MTRAKALEEADQHEKARMLKNAYFHSEVIEFANWVQINEEELRVRYELLAQIESLIKASISDAEVVMFGSTANRLALPGSDIDVLVCLNNVTQNKTY